MFERDLIGGLLPPGEIWTPREGGAFDKFLLGIADCVEGVEEFLDGLAYIREPSKTPILVDLEKEYGVKLPTVDENIRRRRLSARKNVKRRNGTKEQMQFFLDEAELNLTVYANDPAVDPSSIGKYLLVNNLHEGDNNYYAIPTDPAYWPNFIFIGGAATYSGGQLVSIAKADVEIRRWNELRNIIMQLKGMGIWAILQVNLVPKIGDTGNEPFGFMYDEDARGWSDVDNPTVGGRYLGVGD